MSAANLYRVKAAELEALARREKIARFDNNLNHLLRGISVWPFKPTSIIKMTLCLRNALEPAARGRRSQQQQSDREKKRDEQN